MLSFVHTVLSIVTGLLVAIVIWFQLKRFN
jgi:hypothetical protein